MALIEIAHPKFRPWLMSEAKMRNMVYADQIELPLRMPTYPEQLERWVELKDGSRVFMRPLKLTDEAKLREFFYKLSPASIHYRFFRMIRAMPHEQLQELLRIDYEADMAVVVLTDRGEEGEVVGIAHYLKNPRTNYADSAFLIRDDWQGKRLGPVMLEALATTARQHGIDGFTADVLQENTRMIGVFQKSGFTVESTLDGGVYSLRMPFPPEGAD